MTKCGPLKKGITNHFSVLEQYKKAKKKKKREREKIHKIYFAVLSYSVILLFKHLHIAQTLIFWALTSQYFHCYTIRTVTLS